MSEAPLKVTIVMMKIKSLMKCCGDDSDAHGAAEGGHCHDEDEVADDPKWRRLNS